MQSPHRAHHFDQIDLGSAPPLRADGRQHVFDRRQVSLRWVSGAVLTGLTSAFLMGGALFVALDGRQTLAATPDELGVSGPVDRAFQIRRGGDVGGGGALMKADRLKVASAQFASRQVLRLPTLTRVGDKDTVRMMPFVRVSASLALHKTELVAKIPPFNPAKFFNDSDAGTGRPSDVTNPTLYDGMVEGEMSVKTVDLPADARLFDPTVVMASTEVERIVREQARFLAPDTVRTANLGGGGDDVIAVPGTGLGSAMELRITDVNMSYFAKSDTERGGAEAGNGLQDKMINLSGATTLKSVLRDNNADDKMIGTIMGALDKSRRVNPNALDGSYRVRLGLAKIDKSDLMKPVRVSLYNQGSHVVTVALSDEDDIFVVAQEPDIDEDTAVDDDSEEALASADEVPTLYTSLYQTALENQVPEPLIRDIVKMYSYDVDLQSRVRQGDQFEVFYGLDNENDPASASEVLFTSLSVRGQMKKLYRFRSSDDGMVDYFDETGKSGKKFLMRKPMDGGVLRSGFGGRKHPILGYYRMHTGVDWAAPSGTPIYASGNGVVEEATWKGGYGRFLKITHTNGYGTGYAHLSGYAKGIEKGTRVRQGQVVAYVGTTGLSTGPHLHYEVYINGVAVDPMRVKLPRGKELDGPMLAEFRRERERIDTLMNRSGTAKVAAVTK
jgi:murein DD-endopeptidase MepM/ murein hydrolase activator NlpD